MPKTSLHCASLASLLAIAATTPAAAQDLDDPYLAVGLMLGLGGEVEIENASVSGPGGEIMFDPVNNPEADAEVGIGGGAQYIYPLHRYFALGGKFALLSWRSDSDAEGGRNLAFDIALVPQGRLPLSAAVELYLSVPIGVTLDLLNEVETSSMLAAPLVTGGVEAGAGFGFNLAALVGARFALAREFGIFTELGYSLHGVSHDVDANARVAGVSTQITFEVDASWWQIALNAGVYF
jgi:opacity protein-like surface antigen